MKFKIVDAFADELFGGNPAGVVLLPEGKDFPEDEIMRKVAAELRYSETAFVKPIAPGKFNTRYFTPAAEVELCGHATVGSSYALKEWGIISGGEKISYETLAGEIGILVEENSVLMDMANPEIISELSTDKDMDELYKTMGIPKLLPQIEINGENKFLFPKIVSTGLKDIMMPVLSLKELENIKPDFDVLRELSKRHGVVGVHAFCIDTKVLDVHARNFAPLYDIDEEAATGTSNGALAYYLFDYGILSPEQKFTVIQGEKMGRPSKIEAVVNMSNGLPKVKVGGKAAVLADGEINI